MMLPCKAHLFNHVLGAHQTCMLKQFIKEVFSIFHSFDHEHCLYFEHIWRPHSHHWWPLLHPCPSERFSWCHLRAPVVCAPTAAGLCYSVSSFLGKTHAKPQQCVAPSFWHVYLLNLLYCVCCVNPTSTLVNTVQSKLLWVILYL